MSHLDRQNVSITYAKVLCDLLVERGIDQDRLLYSTGITSEQLRYTDEKITNRQFIALVSNSLDLSQDANLGVWFGLQLKISTHGYLGYAALSSPTLGDAIQMAVKYAKTRLSLLQVSFFTESNEAVIQVECTACLEEPVERFLLQSFFTSFGVMGENLIGEIPKQVRALCSYSRFQEDPELAARFQGREPEYDQPVNQIRLPLPLLDVPLVMADPASQELMEAQCRKELRAIDANEDLLIKVRQLISATPGRFPKLEEVAEKCFMSSRTFKRRLAELGTSYQELLDSERRKQAMKYLKHTSKTIDEIASLLGYNDPSNFGRAFKRWVGTTPTKYRNQT